MKIQLILLGAILSFVGSMYCFNHLFGVIPKKGDLKRRFGILHGTDLRPKNKISDIRFTLQTLHKSSHRGNVMVVLGTFIVVWLIVRSFWVATILAGMSITYPKIMAMEKKKKDRVKLNIQFKDAMQSISNSLKAGSSLHTAMERCLSDMKRLYPQKDAPIVVEWEKITAEMKLGRPLEVILGDFQIRLQLEDVDTFVNSTVIIMSKGGELTEILSNVSDVISDRIEVKRDIMTLTAAKRAEAKLLTFMPLVLVSALMVFSPSYMSMMYDRPFGKVLIGIGFLLLGANYLIGKKIIEIDI